MSKGRQTGGVGGSGKDYLHITYSKKSFHNFEYYKIYLDK